MGKKKIELRLLCWQGYRKFKEQYKKKLEEDFNIKLYITEGKNPDIIYRAFVSRQGEFDIVIVDYEYRLLYKNVISELRDSIVRPTQYIKPFDNSSYYCIDNKLCLVPIRFGTNGFVYRIKKDSDYKKAHFNVSLKSTLEELGSSGEDAQKLAIWNWWLPNMMLLAKAEGFNSLENITEKHLKDLQNGILRLFVGCFKNQKKHFKRNPTAFKSLANIIEYEIYLGDSGIANMDWILGPSEMVVAPISSHQKKIGRKGSLNWDIPKEGGLIWLEAAAIWKNIQPKEKRDAALDLLRFIQSEEVQLFLICGSKNPDEIKIPSGHWSYSLNNKGLHELRADIKEHFHNKSLETSAYEFSKWVSQKMDDGRLTLRALPVDDRMRSRWINCWNQVVQECLA